MISVVMPTYNAGEFIARAIDSILAQTYVDWEICIVDDCSTDDTLKVAQEYVEKYPEQIRVKHLDENVGCGLARREAINMCKGDYFAFLDSDDWFEPTMFEDMLKVMHDNGCEIACCGTFLHNNGEYTGQTLAEKDYITSGIPLYKEYMHKSWISQYNGNKIYTRRVIESQEYSDLRFCEDSMTTYKWLVNANQCYVIAKSYYHYWQHPGSNSKTKNSPIQKSFDTVKCVYDHYEFCKRNELKEELYPLSRFMWADLLRCIAKFDINSEEYKLVDNIRNTILKDNEKYNFKEIRTSAIRI